MNIKIYSYIYSEMGLKVSLVEIRNKSCRSQSLGAPHLILTKKYFDKNEFKINLYGQFEAFDSLNGDFGATSMFVNLNVR